MRLADLLAAIFVTVADLLKYLQAADWRWEHAGSGGAVDKATVTLVPDDTGIHADFSWKEAGGAGHRIIAERDFMGKGGKVSLDGVDVPGGSVALSKHIHLWPPRLVVEISVDVPDAARGAVSRYHFTGTVA